MAVRILSKQAGGTKGQRDGTQARHLEKQVTEIGRMTDRQTKTGVDIRGTERDMF